MLSKAIADTEFKVLINKTWFIRKQLEKGLGESASFYQRAHILLLKC